MEPKDIFGATVCTLVTESESNGKYIPSMPSHPVQPTASCSGPGNPQTAYCFQVYCHSPLATSYDNTYVRKVPKQIHGNPGFCSGYNRTNIDRYHTPEEVAVCLFVVCKTLNAVWIIFRNHQPKEVTIK